MPNFKQWAQERTSGGNVGEIYATLYVGEQLERIANALEYFVKEDQRGYSTEPGEDDHVEGADGDVPAEFEAGYDPRDPHRDARRRDGAFG